MLKKSLLLLTLAVCMAGFNGNSEAAAAKALTAKQASIVTVAAFTAQGDLPNLKTALNEALDNGMTVRGQGGVMFSGHGRRLLSWFSLF